MLVDLSLEESFLFLTAPGGLALVAETCVPVYQLMTGFVEHPSLLIRATVTALVKVRSDSVRSRFCTAGCAVPQTNLSRSISSNDSP